MKKIIALLFLSLSLSASYLFVNEYKCIDNYYYNSNADLFVQYSLDSSWATFSTKGGGSITPKIEEGFIYDSNSSICYPSSMSYHGISQGAYNFLMAITGLLFGFSFFSLMNYIFSKVGGKK